jgi:hypothetical protein
MTEAEHQQHLRDADNRKYTRWVEEAMTSARARKRNRKKKPKHEVKK